MIILGVADVPAPAAAVVVGDRVAAWVSGEQLGLGPLRTPVPWPVVDAALEIAGVPPEAVDTVAVAGRLSPMLTLRRRPWLRRWLASATSPLLEPLVVWQALVRHSGLGAYAADVAAEWLDGQFRARGFAPNRVRTVDVHKALAEAAYRMQPDDDVLVVTLHPQGDGVGLAVHRGRAGQLDRLWIQKGFSSLHAHLPRVLDALELSTDEGWRLGGLAARGTVDADLRATLETVLHAEGKGLSGMPGARRRDGVVDAIRAVPRRDAAASVLDNLADTIAAVVRRQARAYGIGTVALAGEAVDHPRIVAQVAACEGVTTVHVLPRPGRDALALGAAVGAAGLAPSARDLHLGPGVTDVSAAAALDAARLTSARRATLVDRLVAGEAVVRFRGQAGPGRHGLGDRCVLVRADDPHAVSEVRRRLGRPDDEEPLVIAVPTPNESRLEAFAALRGPLQVGMAAPRVDEAFQRRYGPSVPPDRRVTLLRAEAETHPGLYALVHGLLRSSGCGAVAAFPLAEGTAGLAHRPDQAVALWRRAGFAALQLGPYYVERDGT